MKLLCIECEKELLEVPVFNGGDEAYPPSFVFCKNEKCKRFGLLSVTYKAVENVKSKRKAV